jgi:hypothetical protein
MSNSHSFDCDAEHELLMHFQKGKQVREEIAMSTADVLVRVFATLIVLSDVALLMTHMIL